MNTKTPLTLVGADAPLNKALVVLSINMGGQRLTLVWLITAVLAAIHVLAFASESANIGALDIFNLVITAGLSPFVAGFLYARSGRTATVESGAAGASIALATIVGVGVAYLVTASGWLAFAGFVLSTAMFTLIPSALIGVIGGWVARKYEPSHI